MSHNEAFYTTIILHGILLLHADTKMCQKSLGHYKHRFRTINFVLSVYKIIIKKNEKIIITFPNIDRQKITVRNSITITTDPFILTLHSIIFIVPHYGYTPQHTIFQEAFIGVNRTSASSSSLGQVSYRYINIILVNQQAHFVGPSHIHKRCMLLLHVLGVNDFEIDYSIVRGSVIIVNLSIPNSQFR